MNISKNGISTSVGVRGASVTFGKNGTYINTGIPGTGLYNRQRIGAPTPKVSPHQSSTAQIYSQGAYIVAIIVCSLAAIACMALAPLGLIGTIIFAIGALGNFANLQKYYGNKSDSVVGTPYYIEDAKKALSTSTDERHKLILSNFINTVETIDAIEDEEQILEKLNKKPTKNADLISAHSDELLSLRRKLTDTQYDVDAHATPAVLTCYEKMCQSYEKLLTATKIWIQTSSVQNTEAKSSASSIVTLKETPLSVGIFNYLKSRFDVPIFPIGKQLLYLYPEFAILAQSPSRFQIVDYVNISIIYTNIHFNEPGTYPADTEKIGTTWEYVNKDGGPDKRYSNNKQISVVRYGGINIVINDSISATFQISNAMLAEDFCSAFKHFIAGNKPNEVGPNTASITSATTTDNNSRSSLTEVIQAADKLFLYLVEMSKDQQVMAAIDRHQQLDCARNTEIGGDKIDNRLGFVAVSDFIKCFEGLGHRPDMSTDEGRAIGLLLTRIMLPNNSVWNDEQLMQQPEGQQILEDAYNLFKNNIHVEFDSDKFLLIEILRHEGVDDEIINRWAVLLYRYTLLIAKADGKLSKAEQTWLTNILSFTKNDLEHTTKYNSTTTHIVLPNDVDSLFTEAARYVVSANTASTTALQRKLSIGYNRSVRIVEQLERAGIVSPAQEGKPRSVIIDVNELEELLHNGSATVKHTEEVPSCNETVSSASVRHTNNRLISNPMKELNNLIGLSNVKTEISNIYNLVKVQKLRVAKGLNVPDISYHCVFTGNPGTGKTTVARLVAQIYKELGILSKGHLVETDRSGLVAEYVGQTAVKTNKIIDSALDGVLFIDEAYSLVQSGSGSDYGLEAIATLLKRMEDNRDRLVVIIAGYSDKMKTFIESNPGLQSRFNRYIHFEDYTAEELVSIFEYNLTKFDYQMTDTAYTALRAVMTEAVANKDKNFGNARFVRNLFEKTLERQAKRLAASSLSTLNEEALAEITEEDIR